MPDVEKAAIAALDRVKGAAAASKISSPENVVRSADLPTMAELETEALIAVAALAGHHLHQWDGDALFAAVCELERMALRLRCTRERLNYERANGGG